MANDEKKVKEPEKVRTSPSAHPVSRGRPLALAVPQVPKSQKPVLDALLRYDKVKWESLLSCLEEAGPFLISEGVEDRISKALDVDDREAGAINYTLTSIYAAHENFGFTANKILRAIKSDPDLAPLLAEAGEDEIGRFLDRLFSLKASLGVVTKAYRLAREHENIFCTSGVTTDLRPVFDEAAETAIAAGIVHHLRISFHKHASDGDFFVALDAADLRQLREEIDLALKKEIELRKLASSINLPVMKE